MSTQNLSPTSCLILEKPSTSSVVVTGYIIALGYQKLPACLPVIPETSCMSARPSEVVLLGYRAAAKGWPGDCPEP